MITKKRLLVFHRTIAPYRIDFFNDLSEAFDARICLQYKNLLNQKFDYSKIAAQFKFVPIYLKELWRLKNIVVSQGYWKQLDKYQPDIVLVSEFGLDCISVLFYRWLKRKKYKVVSVCDDSYNMVAENNDFSRLHRRLRQCVVPKLDELILVEPKVTEWYRNNYGKGFCFPILKDDNQAREIYRHILSTSYVTSERHHLKGKHVVLFVGRLVALKNVETIIKAFANMNNSDNVLVIVGDGPERGRLEQIASERNVNVIFTGRLEGEELYQWYNIASAFVLASYQESFGSVTNEALLAGCKCLISCKAGSACLIEDGKNGYTFEPMNVNDLTEKMIKVLEESPSPTYEAIRPSQMLLHYNEQHLRLVEHLKNL